ncbi:MAG: glycosyltransferase family 2 protein [Desulfovibrionaceae bacterium]
MNDITRITLIIPVYNEEDNLPVLLDEIQKSMALAGKPWEVLFVDDGSKDKSLEVVKRLATDNPAVTYISFAQNRGQSAAFAAGFAHAPGDVVVTMDADLQNDPADIPAMLKQYERGFDMVIGWRATRKDTWLKRKASRFGNFVRNWMTNETVKDTGCSLKVMRADMARRIPMFTGMHRFLPTLMKMQGAVVAEVKVNHRPRLHGTSKYGILDRAMTTWYDLVAVRWMQQRHISYEIKEKN